MLFSRHFWSVIIQIQIKSENYKIQDGGGLSRHLCCYGCYGNQLNITMLRLIESTNEACDMCQMSCQSDDLCQKSD